MFQLFGGSTYYPSGGIFDFIATYATLEEATVAAEGTFQFDEDDPEDVTTLDWWHIVTFQDGEYTVVAKGMNR